MKNSFWELFCKCDEEMRTLALTHSSYAHEHGSNSNERVEFLGDSVLSVIVADYLYKHANIPEGKMSRLRASIVCTKSLSDLAKSLGLEKKILVGKSYKDKISDAVLEDLVESIIGVLYLKYGLHSISGAVIEALNVKQVIKSGVNNDFKSRLQEISALKHSKIEYIVQTIDKANNQKVFRSNLMIDGKFIAYGQGSTKREAEQNSAKKAISKLEKQ